MLADYERVLRQRNSLLKSARGARVVANQLVDARRLGRAARRARRGDDRRDGRDLVEPLHPHVAERTRGGRRRPPRRSRARAAASGAPSSTTSGRRATAMRSDGSATGSAGIDDGRALPRRARPGPARRDRAGITLVGPHRDDVLLILNGLPARGYASHGESWSFALALRLASAELLRAESPTGDPVVILDDVFAELDERGARGSRRRRATTSRCSSPRRSRRTCRRGSPRTPCGSGGPGAGARRARRHLTLPPPLTTTTHAGARRPLTEDDEVYLRFRLHRRRSERGAPGPRRRGERPSAARRPSPFGPGREPRGVADVLRSPSPRSLGWDWALAQRRGHGRRGPRSSARSCRALRAGVDRRRRPDRAVRLDGLGDAAAADARHVTRLVAALTRTPAWSRSFPGPNVPSWKRGPRSVPGRGPRDTYG